MQQTAPPPTLQPSRPHRRTMQAAILPMLITVLILATIVIGRAIQHHASHPDPSPPMQLGRSLGHPTAE